MIFRQTHLEYQTGLICRICGEHSNCPMTFGASEDRASLEFKATVAYLRIRALVEGRHDRERTNISSLVVPTEAEQWFLEQMKYM